MVIGLASNNESQLQNGLAKLAEYGLAKVSNPHQFHQFRIQNGLAKVILVTGESARGVVSSIYSYILHHRTRQI